MRNKKIMAEHMTNVMSEELTKIGIPVDVVNGQLHDVIRMCMEFLVTEVTQLEMNHVQKTVRAKKEFASYCETRGDPLRNRP